jgi:hypothetical protein
MAAAVVRGRFLYEFLPVAGTAPLSKTKEEQRSTWLLSNGFASIAWT